MREGNRDYWKQFQWAPASVGSSAMWETDRLLNFFHVIHQKAITWSQVGHNQPGLDFSQSYVVFILGPTGTADIFWKFFDLFPFPTCMVFLLNEAWSIHSHHSFNLSNLFSEITVPLQNCRPLLLLLIEWSCISDTYLFLNLKTKAVFRVGWHMQFSGCHSEQEHLVRDQTASLRAEDAFPKHVFCPNWKHL